MKEIQKNEQLCSILYIPRSIISNTSKFPSSVGIGPVRLLLANRK